MYKIGGLEVIILRGKLFNLRKLFCHRAIYFVYYFTVVICLVFYVLKGELSSMLLVPWWYDPYIVSFGRIEQDGSLW